MRAHLDRPGLFPGLDLAPANVIPVAGVLHHIGQQEKDGVEMIFFQRRDDNFTIVLIGGLAKIEAQHKRFLRRLEFALHKTQQLITSQGLVAVAAQPVHLRQEPLGFHLDGLAHLEFRIVVFQDREARGEGLIGGQWWGWVCAGLFARSR
jgi:hypothetical protein